MFRIAALNETSGKEDDPDKIKLTKTKEAKEAEAFAVYNKALSYQQKGHSVHAEKLLKNLLVEHPLLQEASDLVEDEKQASIANHRGLQLLYSVHKNMAAIYLHRNELESAIKSYIEAVRIDPSEVTVWFKMGQIALKLDKFALAKICFQQALECNSKHWPSLDQAITLTFALGDYLMCLEYIATALENDSSYLKGLALKKQIVVEQPSLEGMTCHLFDNCDTEIHRVNVAKEERKEFVKEAAKIRSKARQLANDFYEEQNKPVTFLEPLTPFTWKNMGEQLIKLYDFATNNDSPKSLGQEVDLRDYFFLDPTLFLCQDTTDDVPDLKSKEAEKPKSPNRQFNGSVENINAKQLVTESDVPTDRSAFQRASNQSDLLSKAVPDVLGIQNVAKESALLKRMQGRMISSLPVGSKQKLVTSSVAEEVAMDVSEMRQSNEKSSDINDHSNIEDIDMPLLDGVDLDINLTDIQKIDLKPELLLKDDDEEFGNLGNLKSLDNVLSSVIDMEYECEERGSEGNSDNNAKKEESTAIKELSFIEDKPEAQDSSTVSQDKGVSEQEQKAIKENTLKISKVVIDLPQEVKLESSSAMDVSKSLSSPSSLSQNTQPSCQLNPPQQRLGVEGRDEDAMDSDKSLPSTFESTLAVQLTDSSGKPGSTVSESILEHDSSVLKKGMVRSQESSEPMEVSMKADDKKVSDFSVPREEKSICMSKVTEIPTKQDPAVPKKLAPSQLECLSSKPTDSSLMSKDLSRSENTLPLHLDAAITDTSERSDSRKLEKTCHLPQQKSTVSERTMTQDTKITEESMVSPLLKAALTESASRQGVDETKEPLVTTVESQQPTQTTVLGSQHPEHRSKPLENREDGEIGIKHDQSLLQGTQKGPIPALEIESIKIKSKDKSQNSHPVSSAVSSSSKTLKDFSISSLISTSWSPSVSTLTADRKDIDIRSKEVNVGTRDTSPSSSLQSPREPIIISPISGIGASLRDTASETASVSDHSLKRPHSDKTTHSPRKKSTGDLIEDVIRSELNLGGKQASPPTLPTQHPSSPLPKSQNPSLQEHTTITEKSSAHSFSPSQQYPVLSPSDKAGTGLKTQSPPSSSITKSRKISSPGRSSPGTSASSPYQMLHHQHHASLDPFANPPTHSGLPISASDILHQNLHKELAFLNLPMHYLNSISTLEAEAILRKASASSEQQHEDALMRDLLLRHSLQQKLPPPSSPSSSTLPFIYPSRQNLRQISRSLSSPGYFSDQRHQPDFPTMPLHPFLSPPIPAQTAQLALSSYPISAQILSDFRPGHVTTRQLQTIPSPYPLLSHHHDSNPTNPNPYSNLYPPLSPRSKYPLIASTSPSYLRSRLPPQYSSPFDTTAILHPHHIHSQFSQNWLTTTTAPTSSEIEIPRPHYRHQISGTSTTSSVPARKALFSTTSSQDPEGYTSTPAKSKKLSSAHRTPSSTTMESAAVGPSRHDHFQKMIEQMLESQPPSTNHSQTNSTTFQQSPKESIASKNRCQSTVTSTSSTISRQQRGPKRKVEELGTPDWAEVFRGRRSTRSRSSRGKKEEPVMDITKLLLTHFPPSLLELTEVKDVFLGNDDNKEVGKSQGKTGQEVDLSRLRSISDGETEDVKAFLKKCLKGNGILDLIFKYLLHLAGKVNCMWTENLTETFMHVYKRLRKHITAPSVFDNFDGYTPDCLDKYTRVMLAYCELVLDVTKMNKVANATLMSPDGVAGESGMETGSKNVTDQLGDFYNDDMTFLSAVTRCEDIIGSNILDYSVRIYWLKAKYHNLCSETLDAIDCFQMVSDLIGEMKEDTSKVIILPNLKEDQVISQQEVEFQVDALQRFKSLENTRSLFEKGDYSSVVDSLLQTFNKKSVRESKERPSQLLLLQESLERLERKEECLHWAEISIYEALTQFNNVKTQTLKQTWSNAMASLFTATDRLLSENIAILTILGSDRLTRLSHNLVSIIKIILNVGRSAPSEMPINSLLPWIILYKILKYEEAKAEKDENQMEVEDEKVDIDDDDDDDENDSDLKPSIRMLIQAHEHLGRHSWCTKEDGVLLYYLMRELEPLMKEFEEDDDDREICVNAYEQCLLCLYNHPSKKGKAKHLRDHQAKPITLTWDRAVPVFQYFTQSMMPEFDSKKISSITVDVEHLLRRIYILVPPRFSPNSFTDAVTSFIDGTTSDVFIPSTFQQAILAIGNKEDEEDVQKRLYYLLADFYMKNSELKKAVKFYQMDLLINKSRMDSWAGLALAKMSQIEQELSSIDLRLDAQAPKKWDGAMRCFQRAVDCDGKSRKLWVEFGLLAYQLQSHTSRQAKVFASVTPQNDFVQVARDRHAKYLQSAFTSFSHALDCKCDGDGSKDDWLIHYMLGKIAEKQSPSKPGVFLDHYAKAATCLHEEKALYPEKIQFATMPPHLALEALEVFYRCHASILKLLMRDGIADDDLPQVYTASVRSLTGKFARCVKHKGTSAETDREERSSASTSTVQNQANSVTKGKKSSQPKSAISDHSYSKERKTSDLQSSSSKSNATSEKQPETLKVEKPGDQLKEDPTLVKADSVFCHQGDTMDNPKDVKWEKSERMDTDCIVGDESETPFDDERPMTKTNESSIADKLDSKHLVEKPDFAQSQSSQGSEKSISDYDRVSEANRMEVVDSSSQLSTTSNVSGLSRLGYSTAEEPEVTATSSQQSTQGSIDLDCGISFQRITAQQGNDKIDEKEKNEKGFENESDRDEKEMESIPEFLQTDIKKDGEVDGGRQLDSFLKKASLQKQASEGFIPRSKSLEDVMMDSDHAEDVIEEKSERKHLEAIDDNTGEQLDKDLNKDVHSSIPQTSEEVPKKNDSDVSKAEKESVAPSEEPELQIEKNNKERKQEGEAIEKWEKEDQEKSSIVERIEDDSVSKDQLKESVLKDLEENDGKNAVLKDPEEKDGKNDDGNGRDDCNQTKGKEREEKIDRIDAITGEEKDKNKKSVVDDNDDVIIIDSLTEDVAKASQIDEASEAEKESGKADADQSDVVQEVMMEIDDDYVVIPPDVSMIKAELIQNCVQGIEMSACRFSSHYKSVYRLAHFYFHSKEPENVELARDLLLGRPDWQDRAGMPVSGLFFERKGNNFFQGLWKIPIDDIDRSGSFASHVFRSVQLLLDVLGYLGDLEMLNHIRNQMKRTPDAGKKYLRDWDRQLLVDEAFRHMLDVVEKRMSGVNKSQWSEEQKEEHLAHTFCVWRWGKGSCHMTRATGLLHQAFRIMMKGRTDVNRLTPEQAILYCQQNLSKASIQANSSMMSSQTSSPVVKTSGQSTMKKPATSGAPISSLEMEKSKTEPDTNLLKDSSSVNPNEGQAKSVIQHKVTDCVQSNVMTSKSSQQDILCPLSSKSLNPTLTTSSASLETAVPKSSQEKDIVSASKDDKGEKKNSNLEKILLGPKSSQQKSQNDSDGSAHKSDMQQLDKANEVVKERETSSSYKGGEVKKTVNPVETIGVPRGQTNQGTGKGVGNSGWENVFSDYVQKRSGEDVASCSSKGKGAESGEWGNVFSDYVQKRIGQKVEGSRTKEVEKKSWESAFSQFVQKQGSGLVEKEVEGEKGVGDRKKEEMVVDKEGADGKGDKGKVDDVAAEDDEDVIVISDAE